VSTSNCKQALNRIENKEKSLELDQQKRAAKAELKRTDNLKLVIYTRVFVLRLEAPDIKTVTSR